MPNSIFFSPKSDPNSSFAADLQNEQLYSKSESEMHKFIELRSMEMK